MRHLPQRLRDLLVCPRCHGVLVDEHDGLRCGACRVVYPVEAGVPVLLADAARPAEQENGLKA